MTKFILYNSNGEKKDIPDKTEKSDHETSLEFLKNMYSYLKDERDKRIKSLVIISLNDTGDESITDFSLAGFNLPSDDLIVLMEKIKMKLLLDENM